MAKSENKEKKEVPTALKGMRDFIGDEHHKYQGFFEKAAEVALYYGFQPIDVPVLAALQHGTEQVRAQADFIYAL